jgi:predicted acetyltransferase
MNEIRFAREGDILRQKELWKACFGDQDAFIDFYYANRFKPDQTLVLLQGNVIAAMLTMIPVKMVDEKGKRMELAMLYAIATHPDFQKQGLATELMNSSSEFLRAAGREFSVLVPAGPQLFDFYRKQDYCEAFSIREALLSLEEITKRTTPTKDYISSIPSIVSTSPEEYNRRRNQQLKGRLHIAYEDEEILYQKKLSQLSGADIYAIDIDGVEGCAAIERVNANKLLIKELLLPGELLRQGLFQISLQFTVKEYVIRTPAFSGEDLGETIRPFAMIKANSKQEFEPVADVQGYLGLAFD